MWTETTRPKYERFKVLRYASDRELRRRSGA